ncbi:DUF4255 domain-containing protein [Streptomyces macrosporus]|uniref:Pvc16 N-terminal domain-containing protein n=1 Tax=Streptomyces macrosporus TaxID=44032 RepID=A0ABN3JID0_9ACTN
MSNALAIATVTKALALLIESNLQPEIDMHVTVKTERPPAEITDDPTITVFLYQVAPNTSQRNNDLPTRASDGTLLRRPAAALDLHYLISAYGNEAELVGQRLIGCVVRTLHEIPVLPKDVIETAAQFPYLAGSDLAEAVQKVRFAPIQMDVDETSKLWGMLHQTPYSLSVAYQGSLVLIDGRERPVPPKPVERYTVRVAPFGAPGAPERPGLPGAADRTARASGAGAPAAAERASGAAARQVTARASRTSGMAAKTAEPAPASASGSAPSAETGAAAPARRTTAGRRRTTAKSTASRSRPRKAPGTSASGGGTSSGGGGKGGKDDGEG